MALAHMKSAEAAAKIQFTISLLKDGMNKILKKTFGLKKPLDFNNSLAMIGKKIKLLFPDPDVQKQLRGTLVRARQIRNEYSHQDFDPDRFEHDVDCLLKLASLMGLSECIKEIMKFVGTSSTDWENLKKEGNEHYKNERWTEAMNCYTAAIRINANVAILYSNRALCEIRLSKFDLAREDAEDAIELDPTEVKFYRSLSEALCSLQLYKEAQDACTDGLKIDPRDETLLVRLRDCQAYVVDKEVKKHPVAGWSEQMKFPAFFCSFLRDVIKQVSDVSADDVCPMNSIKLQTNREINKAHHILLAGRGNVREEQKALKIYESAANRGSAEGLYNVAIMYLDGRAGLTRDPMKYLGLCRKAAEQKPYLSLGGKVLPNVGVAEAENSIGMAYREGLAVDQDDKLAFQWFLKSAQHGCASGMNNLGLALSNGNGCEQNLTSARWWYQKSSDLGQSEAQSNLAAMLFQGNGGPVDKAKAAELLQSAADQGLPGALESLQQIMRCGAIGSKMTDASRRIVEEKAEKNDKEALFLIGKNYMEAEGGFEKNLKKAEEYLRKASNLNHEKATLLLGVMLLQQKKNEEAVHFLRKAADDGNADAQWTLGNLLSLGHGCERDVAQARRWMLRSKIAGKESVDAIINLCDQIVEFEDAGNLSQCGLAVVERHDRYFEHLAPNLASKKALKDMRKHFTQQQVPLHPACASPDRNLALEMQLMMERVAQGSKTAQKYFLCFDLMEQACLALENKNQSEAFRLFREINRAWQPLFVDSATWEKLCAAARDALEKNQRDAAALFVIFHFSAAQKRFSNAELLRMALTCTELDPGVADYHHLLCYMYVSVRDFESASRSIDRALELEMVPDWLYGRATALRLQGVIDSHKVIEAYEDFIRSSEPDNRKMPEAYYSISLEYLKLKDEKKAKEYFEKGVRAESPTVMLPCFQPVDDFPPKNQLKTVFEFREETKQFKVASPTSASNESCEISDQARKLMLRSKKDSQESVDSSIQLSKEIQELEDSMNLLRCGFAVDRICERHSENLTPNSALKESLSDTHKVVEQQQENPLHPACAGGIPILVPGMRELMAERAAQGSKTAQKYFLALDLLRQACSAVESESPSEAFRLLFEASRTFQPLSVDTVSWNKLYAAATEAFENNQRDASALFVILQCKQNGNLCSKAELLRMALTCTELDPGVADYHRLLGQMYASVGDVQNYSRSIDRALKLEMVPDWLYEKATALMALNLGQPRKIIKAYEDFIRSNEPDNEEIPKAYYCISIAYFMLDDDKKAREYFEKGLSAESPTVRLPCFEPIEDYPPKNQLKAIFELMDKMKQFKLSSPTSASNDSRDSRCVNCGKLDATNRCSKCKKTYYCGRDCQLEHWKEHKKHCRA